MFKKMNKNGYVYLLVSSLLVVVFISSYFAVNEYSSKDRQEAEQSRIIFMNDLVKNLNQDIPRASYISGYRAMIALEDQITTSGVFLTNTSDSFKETFFYGTIAGVNASIMQDSSFSTYLKKTQEIASKTGMNLDININQIILNQHDPWSIEILVYAQVNVTDSRASASWNYEKIYSALIPITSLRDPLYGKYTFNKLPHTIRKFNESILVSGTDTTHLKELLDQSAYIPSNLSPSFLMRFEGKTYADINGIESVVDIRELSDQDLAVNQYAVKIDYIYFNNISTDKICDVQNISEDYYFIIPTDRKDLYQINGLNYSSSCG